MGKILNIVNGDIVLNNLKISNIEGGFLAWGDFLHDGPVPEDLSLEELSKVRATFIAKKGLGEFQKIYQEFKDRDEEINRFKEYKEIYLWFESDIYDQLQLIQILDFFAKHNASKYSDIYIIYPENYLAKSTPEELNNFLLYNQEVVTHNHFITAKKAWSAFTSPSPYSWHKLLDDDTEALPFLKDTVKRVLEEYPNRINGLSRTEHQTLLSISRGYNNPNEIFLDYQKSEMRPFMGEIVFFYLLRELVGIKLLNSINNGKYIELTEKGEEILDGRDNLLKYVNLDKWIGGVHLTNSNMWYWDISSEQIIKITREDLE